MTDDTGNSARVQSDGIVPDTKDWTWVLDRPCDACGFEPSAVDPLRVGSAVRATLPRWRAVLARPEVRRRPAPDVWSPLEYAAHVRDVFGVFDERLALMLADDGARFANWDQDAAALAGRYASIDPAQVADELVAAGEAVARRFDAVQADDLTRRGLRSNGSAFTVATLGVYFLHDVAHHLHDVDG